ncbi:alpha/beta fold hydrolase [Alkalicoccus luteus]|uniref:Alpha/beta hydrolase n=1 Tax=Alkalicoccus luteus TaxID=1237094 RepID=A0A969PRY3_9BACI|nr:alpha/beta hydrolase [Alkalicoccus luteus]
MKRYSIRSIDGSSLTIYTIESNPDLQVIWVHGITSDMDTMQAGAYELGRSGLKAEHLFPVMRGYESSSGLIHTPERNRLIDDLEAVLLNAQGKRLIIAGHSMGCGTILRMIEQRGWPGQVMHIVLLAPFIHPALPVYQKGNEESDDGMYRLYMKRAAAAGILDRTGLNLLKRLPVIDIPSRLVPYDPYSDVVKKSISYEYMMGRFVEKPASIKQFPWKRISVLIGSEDEIIAAQTLQTFLHKEAGVRVLTAPAENHNSLLTSSYVSELFQQITLKKPF